MTNNDTNVDMYYHNNDTLQRGITKIKIKSELSGVWRYVMPVRE